MYKFYHKKIVTTALFVSVLFAGAHASQMDTKGFSKRVIDAVGPANAKVSSSVKKRYEHNGKLAVDGGVIYPIHNGKTGSYYVNEQAHKTPFNKGKKATKNEQTVWDIDVMPDGTGLPEGQGSVEFGDEVYEEKCLSCHGDFGEGAGLYPKLADGNAYEGFKTLKNQRVDPDADGPSRNFGSYWPRASTLWWYIKTGMPHQAPMSLTTEEVYALSAYILYINEIKIDGELVDEDYVLTREKFLKIKLPNHDGFEPNIDGPNGQDNARAYFNNPLNYGNGKERCMKNCFDGEPKVQRIEFVLGDFSPPLSPVKDLPEVKETKPAHPGKANYDASCAVCHTTDAMGAPAVGDKKAWESTLKKGLDTVMANTINGINGMPPRGGSSLSDAALKEVVDYMIEASK